MTDCIIGCDIGTSTSKATIMDPNGKLIASSIVSAETPGSGSGLFEQDPDFLFNCAVLAISHAIKSSNVDPAKVAGVGMSGQAPGCIPVDRGLRPLRPMLTYLDRRGAKEAKWLIDNLGEEEIFRNTANFIDPYYGGVKILWEINHEPEIVSRTRKFLGIKDYVLAKLTGWIGTDYSNAALYGLFFDFRERRWLPEILTFIGLSGSKLPDPVPCHKIVGKINREAALATGLLQGTPVIAGTVDGCASMLAAGVFRPGQSAISLGTSSDWGIECQGDQFVPRTISIPSAASSINQHLVITTIPTAGGFLKWFRDILSMFDEDAISYSSLDLEAENSLPGANGLLAIPHITGQATPFWDPQPHGGFIGLTVAHKRGDLVRAIMESIAYALKENQEWLIAHRFQIGENVGLIGGGASSQLWCQIICDVLGVVGWKNSFSAEPSIGAAILAGIGIGLIPDINAAIAWSESAKSEKFEPDPKHRQLYDELFNCYREFSGSTKNLAHQLSEFSKCLMGSE